MFNAQVVKKPEVVMHGPRQYSANLEVIDPSTNQTLPIKNMRLSPTMAQALRTLEPGSEINITLDMKMARDIIDPRRTVSYVDVLDMRVLDRDIAHSTANSPRVQSSAYEL